MYSETGRVYANIKVCFCVTIVHLRTLIGLDGVVSRFMTESGNSLTRGVVGAGAGGVSLGALGSMSRFNDCEVGKKEERINHNLFTFH